jgi:hypothetical protein
MPTKKPSTAKAPEHQPTVSPDPEESGPSEQPVATPPGREIAIQTPRRIGDEAFSTHELNTINSIVKTAINQSIREELLPSLQEIITNQLQLQLQPSQSRFQTVSPEPPVIEAPVIEAPAIEAPVIEAPAIEAPAIEAPIIEAPVIEPPPPAVKQPPLAYRQLPLRLDDYIYPYFDRQLPPSPKLENTGLFKLPTHTYLPEPPTYEGKYLVYHDVFHFIDALRLSTENVCINRWWTHCLRGSATTWWTSELSDL